MSVPYHMLDGYSEDKLFALEDFRAYLERNKEKEFGHLIGDCPMAGFLSERFGFKILVGMEYWFPHLSIEGEFTTLPHWARDFVSKVTTEYAYITGLQALSVLKEIPAERI